MEERRSTDNPFVGLLRWVPVIVLAAGLIAGAVRNETRDEAQDGRLDHFGALLSVKSLTEFARWQTHVERDIQELRKACGDRP